MQLADRINYLPFPKKHNGANGSDNCYPFYHFNISIEFIWKIGSPV